MTTTCTTRPCTSPARPAPPLPLYLQGSYATHVEADGPSLIVRTDSRSPARYPLNRIARIIANNKVEWRSSALVQCQQHGIPIVFLDRFGDPTGYLQPALAHPSQLDTVLEEMLDRADWQLFYQSWQQAERMQLVQAWIARWQENGQHPDTATIRETIHRHVYQADTTWLAFAQGETLAGALTASALTSVHLAGMKPVYWGQDGNPLYLAQDLARYVALAIHLEWQGLGAAMHADKAFLLDAIHSSDTRQSTLAREWLGHLHVYLKRRLEAWH